MSLHGALDNAASADPAAAAGLGAAPREREVRFPNPDYPYLFLAALHRQASEAVANRATVVPSPSGPAVLIDEGVLDEPIVRSLIGTLEGEVEVPPGAPYVPQEDRS